MKHNCLNCMGSGMVDSDSGTSNGGTCPACLGTGVFIEDAVPEKSPEELRIAALEAQAEAQDEAIAQAAIVGRLGEQVDSLTGKLERCETARRMAESERDEALAKLEAVLTITENPLQRWLEAQELNRALNGRMTVAGELADAVHGVVNAHDRIPTSTLLDLLKGRDECLAVVEGYAWDDNEWWSDSNYLWVNNYGAGPTVPVTAIVLRRDNEGRK